MNVVEIKDLFCQPTDERALLSYCLKDINNYYTLVSEKRISEQDFLYNNHSVLFTIFGALVNQGAESFDLPMLINAAQQFEVLDNIGGVNYLKSINDMSVSDKNFDVYLKNVLESSTKHHLYTMLNDNMDLLSKNAKEGKESADLIGVIENAILDLSTESKAIREPKNLAEGLRELIDERRKDPVEQMGISTGYPILNSQLDGLVPGTLNVISARPKMGKSSLVSNIAYYVAYKQKIPVLYVDTEMPFNQWRDRIVAAMTNIREREIKHGGYSDEVYYRIVDKCLRIVENGKLYHEFMPGYSVEKLVALYKKYKLKYNIGLMVFDYIKEPDSSSLNRQRKEYQILGDVTTKLKDLAGELNVPCLTAVQINREGNVADSDRIARYADVICQWMYKTPEELENGGVRGGTHKLVIRETRRGGGTPEEGIGYNFFKKKLRIKEVAAPDQLIDYTKVVNHGDADSNDEIK